MAFANVSQGAATTAAGSASVTPAFAQATTARNKLVAVIRGRAGTGAHITCSDGTWTRDAESVNTGGTSASCGIAIFSKDNCGAGETAPTFTWTGATAMRGALAEFSGEGLSFTVDQTGVATGTASPLVPTAPSADKVAGNLIVMIGASGYGSAVVATTSDTPNNGATAAWGVNNDSGSAPDHWRGSYGITTGNGAADSNSFAFTGAPTDGRAIFVSYAPAFNSSDSPSGTVTLSGSDVDSISYSDSPSGSIVLGGSSTDSITFSDVVSGVISFFGSIVEHFIGRAFFNPDTPDVITISPDAGNAITLASDVAASGALVSPDTPDSF